MKQYTKPAVQVILLKTEERLAGSTCTCCGTQNISDSSGNIIYTALCQK